MTDNDNTQDSAAMPPASVGSVSEPVAWVAFATDASESRAVCLTRQEAETVSRKHGWGVAPLYAVRLTDAEREAVETAEASLMRESTDRSTPEPVRQRFAAAVNTLRWLLDRTK